MFFTTEVVKNKVNTGLNFVYIDPEKKQRAAKAKQYLQTTLFLGAVASVYYSISEIWTLVVATEQDEQVRQQKLATICVSLFGLTKPAVQIGVNIFSSLWIYGQEKIKKQINKFNDGFKTTQTQLQWLLYNNIYNFYLMHKNRLYNLKFSETFHKFHSIALKQYDKTEPNYKKISKDFNNLQSSFLCAKFLLLLFLNNFMVNIWKENSLSLKKLVMKCSFKR